MTEKIYPQGIRCFPKKENQPEFVIGAMVISPNVFFKWLKENEHLLSSYKDEKQLRMQILNGQKGLYVTVDTWKQKDANPFEGSKSEFNNEDSRDELPF